MSKRIKIKLQGTNHFITADYYPKNEVSKRPLSVFKGVSNQTAKTSFSNWKVFKLKDGQYIITEKLAKGYIALLKDGICPPLREGVHELVDGRRLIMLTGGIIGNIIEK